MKPGDEGGTDPLTRLLFRRRRKKQHPRRIAAAPKIPKGIPTPSPIFWVFVSPLLLAGGAAGSSVALGVEGELLVVEIEDTALEPDKVEDVRVESLLDWLADDLVDVENVTIEDITTDRLRDADTADDCDALLGREDGIEVVACEDCHALLDLGQSHSLCVGVACGSVVWGGTGGDAVFGPNSWTR
jgi:hypothetical protein